MKRGTYKFTIIVGEFNTKVKTDSARMLEVQPAELHVTLQQPQQPETNLAQPTQALC